jgi:hypothetical protein
MADATNAANTINTPGTPHAAAQTYSPSKPKVSTLQVGEVEEALTQALPVPDIVFGGIVLVLVVMFHAVGIRLITNAVLKRAQAIRLHRTMWQVDLAFSLVVAALLGLHLAEVMLWTAALYFAGIVPDWSKAAYFAANCYTALGEPFTLPHAWRIVPPIIAMSGIFTFAWTASVLVDVVSRYNEARVEIFARLHVKDRHPPQQP